MSDLDEEGGLLADDANRSLEEKEARAMASTTALRRDLAPIVSVRVVQETGGRAQQVIDSIQTAVGDSIGAAVGPSFHTCYGYDRGWHVHFLILFTRRAVHPTQAMTLNKHKNFKANNNPMSHPSVVR